MAARSPISRADAETACLLQAVGTEGCTLDDYLARIGVSASVESAVRGMLAGMAAHIVLVDDRLTLTPAGIAFLTTLGVRPSGAAGGAKKSRANV
jgi:hypothetical protein